MRVLVIEGGSMRAAYGNGVLQALQEADATAWDAVYGTSAGAALAAWFSAGQADTAARTWTYAGDDRIISWRRWLLRQGPLLDHDALFDIVYREHLDVEAVRKAPHPVIAPVVDAGSGELHHVDVREGPVLDWLRAAGRMPLASGPPVEVEGRRWLDGGLADALPVARALEDGATELLVVLNRPPEPRTAESRIASWLVERRFPGLGPYVAEHHADWNGSVALAQDPPEGVRVDLVHPSDETGLSRLTRDRKRIENAIARGRRDGEAYLERDDALP